MQKMQEYIVYNPQILSSQYDNNPSIFPLRFFRSQNSILSCKIREKSLYLQLVKMGALREPKLLKLSHI